MLWNVLFLLFSPWYLLLGRLLRDDRDRQILLLHQQLLIVQRRVGKRLSLSRGEKLTLVLGSLGMKTRQLLDSLVLIKPATLVGWHREIVRRHWTFPAGRRPGRPLISEEARRLVIRIARDNPRMGYTKLAGEMRKLGCAGFGRSTVARILQGTRPHSQATPRWRPELAAVPVPLRSVHLGQRLLHRHHGHAADLLPRLLPGDWHPADPPLGCLPLSGRSLGIATVPKPLRGQ